MANFGKPGTAAWEANKAMRIALFKNHLTMKELMPLFKYKSLAGINSAICSGVFPVPTYKLAGIRVADLEVVRAYFEAQHKLGMQHLEKPRKKYQRRHPSIIDPYLSVDTSPKEEKPEVIDSDPNANSMFDRRL